ncbi:FRG domain-containing protein [Aeromicrobium tamlense]
MFPTMYASGLRRHDGKPASEAERAALAAAIGEYITSLAAADCRCGEGPFPFGTAHRCAEQIARGPAGPLVGSTFRAVVEPLLQHYGIRTRWLDVVDNIWIALWFACHTEETAGVRHAFHARRSPDAERAAKGPSEDRGTDFPTPMAYVAVLDTGRLRPTNIPGYSIGEESRIVDLRYAVPSVYLRPHAQHGLLVAPAKLLPGDDGALTHRVVAYIEIPLMDALDWLGSGVMTSPFVLFPPAVSDHGYRRLLDYATNPPGALGAVKIYGPGA